MHDLLDDARVFGFTPTEHLVVLVRAAPDAPGELPSLLEREDHPDGDVRYVLHLALGRQGERAGSGADAAMAELGRKLLRLQRELEGTPAARRYWHGTACACPS